MSPSIPLACTSEHYRRSGSIGITDRNASVRSRYAGRLANPINDEASCGRRVFSCSSCPRSIPSVSYWVRFAKPARPSWLSPAHILGPSTAQFLTMRSRTAATEPASPGRRAAERFLPWAVPGVTRCSHSGGIAGEENLDPPDLGGQPSETSGAGKWCDGNTRLVLHEPEDMVAAETGSRTREVSRLCATNCSANWGGLALRKRPPALANALVTKNTLTTADVSLVEATFASKLARFADDGFDEGPLPAPPGQTTDDRKTARETTQCEQSGAAIELPAVSMKTPTQRFGCK
jgi:hypothetical protein